MTNKPIICHTNLDTHGEMWPDLDHVPQIGSRLVSTRNGSSKVELHLKVCGVTYYDNYISVELHLTGQWESVNDFTKWYREHR